MSKIIIILNRLHTIAQNADEKRSIVCAKYWQARDAQAVASAKVDSIFNELYANADINNLREKFLQDPVSNYGQEMDIAFDTIYDHPDYIAANTLYKQLCKDTAAIYECNKEKISNIEEIANTAWAAYIDKRVNAAYISKKDVNFRRIFKMSKHSLTA